MNSFYYSNCNPSTHVAAHPTRFIVQKLVLISAHSPRTSAGKLGSVNYLNVFPPDMYGCRFRRGNSMKVATF